MNDNEPLGDYGIPHWACKIVDNHDLGLRADNPLAAATVLLTDAGDIVREIGATAFREQALTPSTRQRLCEVIEILTDAERLSAICEDEPSLGNVMVQADGIYRWEPAPHGSSSGTPFVAPSSRGPFSTGTRRRLMRAPSRPQP